MNLIPWRNKQQSLSETGSAEPALSRFRTEVDSLLERFFRDPWDFGDLPGKRSAWGPRMDLAESEDAVTVKAELPGVDSKDIDINVTGNLLTIRGEKRQDREEKDKDYHYIERQSGSFCRTVTLPVAVDPERVTAEFRNGVLTVSLPKHPQAKPRRITVKGG